MTAQATSPWRWVRWLLLALFVLVVIVVALVGWAVATQSGLRTLVGLATPEQTGVSIGEVRGRLLGTMEFRELTFVAPGLTAELEQLELKWQPQDLLRGQLTINQLQAGSLVVTQDDQLQDSTSEKLKLPESLSAPLGIYLNQASLQSITYRRADTEVSLALVELQGHWIDDALTVEDFSIESDLADLDLMLTAQLAQDYELSAQGNFSGRVAGYADLVGELTLAGPLEQPELAVELNLSLIHI